MINFAALRIAQSVSRAVTSPLLITAEGQALVADDALGNGVALAGGGATEKFVGISISQQRSLSVMSHVEEITVAADGTFSTSFVSLSLALERFAIVTAGVEAATALDMTPATPGAPTILEADYLGVKAYKTHVSNAGKTVRAYYRYAPTLAQAQAIQGDVLPGGDSGVLLNLVGVITQGDVYTTEFDPSVNWAGSTADLRLKAGGLFTLGGSGAAPANVRVISRPTSTSPFLGLAVNNG